MDSVDRSRLDLDAWLLGEARQLELAAVVEGLGHRLTAHGLPLHRLGVSFGLLNPSLLAAGMIWRPGTELEFTRYDYAERTNGLYERSPFKVAAELGRWLELDLATTPDEAFGIVPELKAQGLAHYIVIVMPDSSGRALNLTVATREPAGFDAEHRAILKAMLPALSAVVEVKTLRTIMTDVLSAYVGRSPAREIVAGTVHRGQTTQFRAAILVADLRGFTHLSTRLPASGTAEVINRYYDVVVPAIEAHGGEVLKFIGDAVLAIFPAARVGDDAAVLGALDAARRALATQAEPYILDGVAHPIRFGIAIHLGEAVYGNVGSGDRLDFTVIGRDVNVAARIASLCSRLGRDYLVSQEVADIGRRHGRPMADAGAHDVRGLARPLAVHVPDAEVLEPEHDDGISQGLVMISPA
ncbi:adenylate/guanylate cyclase domain-containing protein [Acuticoccus sp.]|uniref:adenylate/guanylate cyclase domain-containing protein n=1 Tax=Acuticoccus sp. TaxID=1904378 RepID=UPI003B516C20